VEELAFDDARVLLGGLVDSNGVISEVERNDEATVEVLGNSSVELGGETQDSLIVVHGLEEVFLWSLRDELVHLTKTVLLVAEAIVGRLNRLDGLGRSCELNLTEREFIAILGSVVGLSELIDTGHHIDAAVSVDIGCGGDLVASQVVVTDEALAWLVSVVAIGKLLAAEQESKGIPAVVGEVALTDLKSVISQVVVDSVGEIVTSGEVAEHLAVFVQELLLGHNFAATHLLLHVVTHLWVINLGPWDLRLGEVVHGGRAGRRQLNSSLTVELASVFITVVDADLATIKASVCADVEVIWHEGVAVGLKSDMTLEEGTLRCSRVDLLRLSHHD